MIEFEKFTLDNGLRVIVHRDESTPIVAVNTLYDVGARDEDPERTGFAHLFEHLMFGGSVNIPDFDAPLQRVGGENNAFTSNDITNYYETLPLGSLETALWLESDRMLSLAFTPKSLEVQRQVVVEEFKQRYLNQPYGDVWLLLRPLTYKKHPYRWPTIGKEIAHIEEATLDDVKAFFAKHYHPGQAILSIAGNVDRTQIESLVRKWYGDIPAGEPYTRSLPKEPEQTERRFLEVERAVPANALYMVWHMPERSNSSYYVGDLLSDVLSRGTSSRLQSRLIRDKGLFSEIGAYISGDQDPGLFVLSGKLAQGVRLEDAEAAVWEELEHLLQNGVEERELEKVKNKLESTRTFSEMNVLNKAMSLAMAELHLGGAEQLNFELEKYREVGEGAMLDFIKKYLKKDQVSVLFYRSKSS